MGEIAEMMLDGTLCAASIQYRYFIRPRRNLAKLLRRSARRLNERSPKTLSFLKKRTPEHKDDRIQTRR